MREAQDVSTTDTVRVKVSRFTEPTQEIDVPKDSKVSDALEKAGISLSESESVWVDGESAELNYIVEDGDLLQVVGKKDGGAK